MRNVLPISVRKSPDRKSKRSARSTLFQFQSLEIPYFGRFLRVLYRQIQKDHQKKICWWSKAKCIKGREVKKVITLITVLVVSEQRRNVLGKDIYKVYWVILRNVLQGGLLVAILQIWWYNRLGLVGTVR